MLHKKIQPKRIQGAFNDGIVKIVELVPRIDKFNTPLPSDPIIKELGQYHFRLKAVHTADRQEFMNTNVTLEHTIRIKMNSLIHAGMTASINGELYDIVKTYPDFKEQELELLLAKHYPNPETLEGDYNSYR